MARERRIDRADLKLRPPQKREDGSVRYDAVFTRAGVFEYSKRNADGTTTIVREYRSPKEVGRADSLATLELAHVTNRHPPKKGMAKALAVGTTGTDIKFDEATGLVTGSCLIRDDATNKDVDGGIVELSCGYEVDILEKPGVTPDGQRYDREQVDVVYEHVALVPKGRAGSDVRLRTDGAMLTVVHGRAGDVVPAHGYSKGCVTYVVTGRIQIDDAVLGAHCCVKYRPATFIG